MKKAFVFSLSIFAITAVGQPVINVTPPVKNITVYLSGAVVTHEARVKLPSGTSTVVFHGLPSRIDPQSIQLAATGGITILSVSNHTDYLSVRQKSGKMKRWQDSLDILNTRLERVTDGIEIMHDSKTMLDNNRIIGGANTGTTLANFKPMYEYYMHQVSRVDDSLIGLQKQKKYLDVKIAKIEGEINEWRRNTDTITGEVEAIVSSDRKSVV